jgi:hypothetical protein
MNRLSNSQYCKRHPTLIAGLEFVFALFQISNFYISVFAGPIRAARHDDSLKSGEQILASLRMRTPFERGGNLATMKAFDQTGSTPLHVDLPLAPT